MLWQRGQHSDALGLRPSRHCLSITALPTLPAACPHLPFPPRLQGNPKFLEAVASWQRKLGSVDLVLGVWGDVQRKWQALESIFVGSADIRVQLPEDSKRFDAANADYVVGWGGFAARAGDAGGWALVLGTGSSKLRQASRQLGRDMSYFSAANAACQAKSLLLSPLPFPPPLLPSSPPLLLSSSPPLLLPTAACCRTL